MRNPATLMSFSAVLDDPALFGSHFDGASWNAWNGIHKAIDGVALSSDERSLFTQLSGREPEAVHGIRELWNCKGRGSGGSRMLAARALHSCIFVDWRAKLAPGETATALILASDLRQASETFGYVTGLADSVPMISGSITRRTQSMIEFSNRTRVEVRVSNFRRVRGYSLCFAGLDELAFWADKTTGANPARQVYDALLPALGRLPGSFLMAVSTPWSASGFFAEQIRKHHGKDSPDALALIGDTLTFNPSFNRAIIDSAYEADPIAAASEYGGLFRQDVSAFISREVLETCTASGVHELPPSAGLTYCAFADPSGGSSDSFTLAVAHTETTGETSTAVLDCIREIRPPFSPASAVAELSAVLKSYGLTQVSGDAYAGVWPKDEFSKHDISYLTSERNKNQIYVEALPLLNSQRVRFLDHKKMLAQFAALERQSRSGGRDTVDHPRGAHDDIANSVAGALLLASENYCSADMSVLKQDRRQRPLAAAFREMSANEGQPPRVGEFLSQHFGFRKSKFTGD